jgi:hypothetical protein
MEYKVLHVRFAYNSCKENSLISVRFCRSADIGKGQEGH